MDNTDFLNEIHRVDEAASGTLEGIDKVLEGGSFDGIPESDLLEAFKGLRVLVGIQQELIRKLVEENLEMIDSLERLVNKTDDSS